MDTTSILKQIIIKASHNQVTEENIKNNSKLVGDFGLDSIAIVQMIVDIETQFNIELENAELDLERLTKFGTLCEIINSKIVDSVK